MLLSGKSAWKHETYLNIDPKDMLTAVSITSSPLLDQNTSEKLSIYEYSAIFRLRREILLFPVTGGRGEVHGLMITETTAMPLHRQPLDHSGTKPASLMAAEC